MKIIITVKDTDNIVGLKEDIAMRLEGVTDIVRIDTADVAPKSEVERLEHLRAELSKEIETLKDNNEHLAVLLAEAKSEVAREIFGEAIRAVYSKTDMKIYNTIEGKPLGDGVAFGKQQAMYDVITLLAELKKKYTEERNG